MSPKPYELTITVDREAIARERADAIQAVAKMLPDVRELRGEDEMIHPNMPEDDAAIVRCLRAMIDRGDQLATDLRRLRDELNELGRRVSTEDVDAEALLYELFEDGVPGRTSIYEWQKSRERMAFVAERRSIEAYREAQS